MDDGNGALEPEPALPQSTEVRRLVKEIWELQSESQPQNSTPAPVSAAEKPPSKARPASATSKAKAVASP